jgi:cytochrome c-type biogenesis protein CcmH
MTAAAVFAVLWPLSRRPRASADALAFYRAQLEELDRECGEGRLSEQEAAGLRVEISRRMIAAADAQPSSAFSAAPVDALRRRRIVAAAALIVIPLVAIGLYSAVGSPDLPGQPRGARSATDQLSIEALVARVEQQLERQPDDARGWEVIAPVYLRIGRYDDAVRARRNVIRLLGDTAEREADLGEALVSAADGVVTTEAVETFRRAVDKDQDNVRSHFYLGLAAEQDGNKAEALRAWKDLISRAPAGAPWVASVQNEVARLEGKNAEPSQQKAPGPTQQDVAAAEGLSPQQRTEMIRGMVDRLASRLQADGSDVQGWIRLIRAYHVMGEDEKARSTAEAARRALASDQEKAQQFESALKQAGG